MYDGIKYSLGAEGEVISAICGLTNHILRGDNDAGLNHIFIYSFTLVMISPVTSNKFARLTMPLNSVQCTVMTTIKATNISSLYILLYLPNTIFT